jgi:CheY-like chemotaxis protein
MITQEESLLEEPSITAPPNETAAKRARVLLAEDDRSLRRYLEVVIGRAGFDVVSVPDGLQAMKTLLTSPIDIVITDATMPNLSGYELSRFLRNTPHLSRLPIILLSAQEKKESSQEAEPVDAFLAKPVSAVDLIDCIGELLSARTSPKE